MSGPKAYSYRVESAEERQRRLLNEASARCRALDVQLAGRHALMRQHGLSAVRSSETSAAQDLDQLQRREATLRAAIADADRAIEARQAEARVAAIRSSLGAHQISLGAGLDGLAVSRATSQPAGEADPADAAQALEPRVARLVAMAAEIADDAERAAVIGAAGTVLSATGAGGANAQLTGLEVRASAAIRRQSERRRSRERVQEALLSIAHINSSAADSIREAAASADDADAAARVAHDAAALVAEHEAELDQSYVREQVLAAFASLGYASEPGASGNAADVFYLSRAGLGPYSLRVEVNGIRDTLLTSIAADGDTAPQQDIAAETETCEDLRLFQSELARRGVLADMTSEAAPGEWPPERRVGRVRPAVPQARRSRADQGRRTAQPRSAASAESESGATQ